MSIAGWRYYNHAVIPTIAPHEIVDETILYNGDIWKGWKSKHPIMVRWTTDFDCGYKTNFWYVIKDDLFDLTALKAKRRYEINKGKRYFHVKRVEGTKYLNEIFQVRKDFFCDNNLQPEEYEEFLKKTAGWEKYIFYIAVSVETDEVCGYARVEDCNSYFDFMNLTVKPKCERFGINAAIVAGILDDLNRYIEKGKYLCDGSRNILHQTQFQDYLEKYFGFRKAYCRLHILYPWWAKIFISILRPFNKAIQKKCCRGIMSKIAAILAMDEMTK